MQVSKLTVFSLLFVRVRITGDVGDLRLDHQLATVVAGASWRGRDKRYNAERI